MKGLPTKRRIVFVVLGVFALMVGAAVVAFCSREKEPEYQGKKLSEWLEMYVDDPTPTLDSLYSTPESRNQHADICRAAIRQIGTNGLPHMISWLHYERPHWRSVTSDVYAQFPSWLRWPWLQGRLAGPGWERRRQARWGFWALGQDATPAIPALVALTHDGDRKVAWAAIACLGFVGPAATAHLERLKNGADLNTDRQVNGAILDSQSMGVDPTTGKRTLVWTR